MQYTELLNQLKKNTLFAGDILCFINKEQKDAITRQGDEWKNHHLRVPSSEWKKQVIANQNDIVFNVVCCYVKPYQTSDNHYYGLVFIKSTEEMWFYNPEVKGDKSIRSWPSIFSVIKDQFLKNGVLMDSMVNR